MALGAKEDSLVMLSLDIQCYELILYYHAYLKGSMAVKIYILDFLSASCLLYIFMPCALWCGISHFLGSGLSCRLFLILKIAFIFTMTVFSSPFPLLNKHLSFPSEKHFLLPI